MEVRVEVRVEVRAEVRAEVTEGEGEGGVWCGGVGVAAHLLAELPDRVVGVRPQPLHGPHAALVGEGPVVAWSGLGLGSGSGLGLGSASGLRLGLGLGLGVRG